MIPAYEEAEALPGLLRRIPDAVWCGIPVAALVVDDGSRDGTAGVARANGARVVSHATNLGGGAALATGFALAVAEGARAVVTMDADGQHLPEEMPALLEPVLDGRAGLAVGSRALGSADPNAFARELGIAVFNRLISVLTGSRITDCSNGYRAMRTDVIPQLDLRQRQFHTSEFLIQAIARGIEVVEVPVTVVARTHGATKKPRALRYGFGFARAIIGTWARTLPLRVAARSRRSARTRPAR